jgi:hypothetical protein
VAVLLMPFLWEARVPRKRPTSRIMSVSRAIVTSRGSFARRTVRFCPPPCQRAIPLFRPRLPGLPPANQTSWPNQDVAGSLAPGSLTSLHSEHAATGEKALPPRKRSAAEWQPAETNGQYFSLFRIRLVQDPLPIAAISDDQRHDHDEKDARINDPFEYVLDRQ